jgi:uncharacterized protein Yka (UPF0111/DUF47 family)
VSAEFSAVPPGIAHALSLSATMHEKQTILEALDRRELLLPALVHDALDANARIKYYLSLLQMAAAHAETPDAPAVDLAAERERCGISDQDLDTIVEGARRGLEDDGYRIPRLHEVVARVESDLGRMIEPVSLLEGAEAADRWLGRLRALHDRHEAACGGDCISPQTLGWLTSADPSRDGAHRLCLDLHKQLEAVEASIAETTIQGAHAFALAESDGPLVEAFMTGVQRTARLKFEHPGLGTTATRRGARLVLENDIGTTDAHVLVVEIEGTEVVVTSADVHVQRLAFFQRMVSPGFDIAWDDTRSRRARGLEDDVFFVCTAKLRAADAVELGRFLEHLGSRLVFLIDWNKARKMLQAFVPKAEALSALDWAADANLGHRALLELGGELLLYDAMAAVMRTPLRFGERLDDAIGVGPAADFVRSALRETAEGLLEKRSRSLIRERVRAELASAFLTAGDRLVEPARRHAAVVRELASMIRDGLAAPWGSAREAARHQAALAKEREHAADEIVDEVRGLARRVLDAPAFERVMESADDAADELEDAIFLATLLPESFAPEGRLADSLRHLGDVVTQAGDAWAACVEAAQHARRGAGDSETRVMLDEVDHIVTAEREADEVERRVLVDLMAWEGLDGRALLVMTRLVHHVESATDALLHAALELRDYVTGT